MLPNPMMRTNGLLLAAGLTVFSLFSVMSCDKDEDRAGCTYPAVYDALVDGIEPNARIERARLNGSCLEVVWRACQTKTSELTLQKSALAVYPPTYVASLRVQEKKGIDCYFSGPDSTSYSLKEVRARDAEFDLRFRDIEGLVIEVR